MVGFLAAGFTYSTALVDYLVYQPDAAREAAAAGYILLSMVMVSGINRRFPVRRLTPSTDRVDILFRVYTTGHSSRLYRFFCASQGATTRLHPWFSDHVTQ